MAKHLFLPEHKSNLYNFYLKGMTNLKNYVEFTEKPKDLLPIFP